MILSINGGDYDNPIRATSDMATFYYTQEAPDSQLDLIITNNPD